MDIFDLAIEQVRREGKMTQKDWMVLVLDRALKIRRYLDMVESNRIASNVRWGKK